MQQRKLAAQHKIDTANEEIPVFEVAQHGHVKQDCGYQDVPLEAGTLLFTGPFHPHRCTKIHQD